MRWKDHNRIAFTGNGKEKQDRTTTDATFGDHHTILTIVLKTSKH